MPHIQLLGEVGVSSPDGPTTLRSGKELGLVALLAEAHPRPLTRRLVLDLLWPGSGPDRARRSLNQAVYAIRRALGQDSLRVRLDLLALEGSGWTCDLWKLDGLVAESAANRAPVPRFAQSGRLPDTVGFLEWVDRTRARVDAHLVAAYCAELSKLMDRGRFEHVEPLARAALEIDPYAETALYHLAMSMAGSGRITAALQELRSGREKFRADLDKDLPAAFDALERRLESAEAFEAMRRPKSSGAQSVTFAFVGREQEFAHLRGAWDRIRDTGRRIVLVSGEPGIGKTRLVDRLARLVSIQGGRVLHAECFAAHKRVPFAALSEALRGLRAEEIADLDLIWRKVLFTSFALEAAGTDLEPPPRLEPAAEQLRLFESVVLAIQASAAERPVLVLIDDLQWLDQSSAAVLQHVIRRCEEDPVLLVFAARERELRVNDELREFVANNRGAHFTDVELGVLDEKASEELVKDALMITQTSALSEPPAGLADKLGGHPFLITESIQSGFALRGRPRRNDSDLNQHRVLSSGLDNYFSNVFSGLQPDAVELATTLGVWQGAASLKTFTKFLKWSEDRAVKAAENLLKRGIIDCLVHGVDFKHGLYRDWVYAKTSIPRRIQLHHSIGVYISSPPHNDYPTATMHYAKAGESSEAYRYALAAAHTLELEGAFPEAEHFLRLATHHSRTENERQAAESQLANHLFLHSSHKDAKTIYERLAADTLASTSGSRFRLLAKARLVQIHVTSADADYGQLCLEALRVMNQSLGENNPEAAAAALNAVTRCMWYGGNSQHASAALNAASTLMKTPASVIDSEIENARLAILLVTLAQDREVAFRILRRTQAKSQGPLSPHVVASLAQIEGIVMWAFGDLGDAVDAWLRALAAAREGGSILFLTTSLINLSVALHYLEPSRDVDHFLEEATAEARRHGFSSEESSAQGNRALFAWENRRLDRVTAILEPGDSRAVPGDGPGAGVILSVRGLMEARRGEMQQAESLLEQALHDVREGPSRCQDPSALLQLSQVIAKTPSKLRRAREVAEEIRGSVLVGQVCEWKVGLEWARIATQTGDPALAVSASEAIGDAARRARAERVARRASDVRRLALSQLTR